MSMAGLLVTLAAVAVGLSVLWKFGAFLLGAVAWFLVATMAVEPRGRCRGTDLGRRAHRAVLGGEPGADTDPAGEE